MQANDIPIEFGNQVPISLDSLAADPIWVAWFTDAKGRKMPLDPNAAGGAAKADDPKTWGSRKAAQRLAQRRKGDLGVQLSPVPSLPGWRLCGVDLDGCLDASGEAAPWASAVVSRFNSYAEVSPSGSGLHVLFLARESDFAALRDAGKVTPLGGKPFSRGKHTEIALYLGGRYFTVTGNAFDPSDMLGAEPIRPVSREALEWLITDHGPAFLARSAAPEDSPNKGDDSGSGAAFKMASDLASYGMVGAEAREAMAEDDSPAGEWWNRVDTRQQDRVIAKAFARVAEERARIADSYDDAPEDDDIDAFLDGLTAPAPPKAASRLTFLTPGECANLPARDYLVKGLIAPGQVGCIFGDPGAGKSLIAPRLAYAIAQGAEAFGLRTRQGGVFYVACEDEEGMAGRVTALHADLGEAPAFHLVRGCSDLFSSGQISGKGSPDFEALRREVKARKPKLIIIDTLAMAMPGLDENDGAGMRQVVQIGTALAWQGAAVIYVHHGTKAEGNTPRGHSVFNGALYFSIQVKAADQSGIVRGLIRKNKNGPAEPGLAFRIGTRLVGTDIDGEPVHAPICEPCDPLDAVEAGPHLSPAQRAALALAYEMAGTSGRVSEAEWRDAAIEGRAVSGVDDRSNRRKAVSRALQALAQAGQVRVADGVIFLARMESLVAKFDGEGFEEDGADGED